MSFQKNTAVTGFTFALVSKADGSAITSGTVAGFVTRDGGSQASLSGSATHEGNGQWSINLTAGEMNGDVVGLLFTHSQAVPVQFTIRTATYDQSQQFAETANAVWAHAARTLTAFNFQVTVGAAGLDLVLIDGQTLPSALRIIAATTAGKLSGSQTATEVFKGLDGVTTRVTVTADASGNRTAVVYG